MEGLAGGCDDDGGCVGFVGDGVAAFFEAVVGSAPLLASSANAVRDVVAVYFEDAGGAVDPATDEFFEGSGVPDDVVDSFDWRGWFVSVDCVSSHLD